MKKILNIFFVTLGVIFLVILLAVAYLFIFDPLNLKPLFSGDNNMTATEENSAQNTQMTQTNPLLSESQTQALEKFGLDPNIIPSQFTAEQEACFVEILGSARVEEIKAGSTPSVTEYFQARGCL